MAIRQKFGFDPVQLPPDTGEWARGPGVNQPAGHSQLFQLITTGHEQKDVITATQPAGQATSTNRATITALGGNPDSGTQTGANWIGGIRTVFNVIDPVGEIPWPCMEWKWFPGDPVDAAASLYSFNDWGPITELYMREIVYIDPGFQMHRSGDLKGIRVYKGANAIGHVPFYWPGSDNDPFGIIDGSLQISSTQGAAELWRAGTWTTPRPQKGRWLELETLWKRESAIGVQDGSVRAWVDGVEKTNWGLAALPTSAVNFFDAEPRHFSAIQISHYRGGSNGVAITAESVLRVADIYFSAKIT